MDTLYIFLGVLCFGIIACSLKDVETRLPMLDGSKRPLTVDIDVSEFNDKIKKIVVEDLPEEITEALEKYITSSRFRNTVQNSIDDVMTKMLETKIEKTVKMKIESLNNTVFEQRKQLQQLEQGRQTYAFFAALSASKQGLPRGSVLVFDSVKLNIGNNYDGTTGEYTCPESGIYTFSWTTLSHIKAGFASYLMINSRIIAENSVDNEATGDGMTGSVTTVVHMQKGEKAWIQVVNGKYVSIQWWGSGPNTVFSGYRIY